MKLVFDYPPSVLLPNRKSHWGARKDATRMARWAARCKAGDAIGQSADIEDFYRLTDEIEACRSGCVVTITFYPPTGNIPDYDSIHSASKPIMDGIVDAGILKDDSPKIISAVTLRMAPPDKKNPRTEVEIIPLVSSS